MTDIANKLAREVNIKLASGFPEKHIALAIQEALDEEFNAGIDAAIGLAKSGRKDDPMEGGNLREGSNMALMWIGIKLCDLKRPVDQGYE